MNVIEIIWNTLGTLDLEMLCVVGIWCFLYPLHEVLYNFLKRNTN
jgi:hypothetical protein